MQEPFVHVAEPRASHSQPEDTSKFFQNSFEPIIRKGLHKEANKDNLPKVPVISRKNVRDISNLASARAKTFKHFKNIEVKSDLSFRKQFKTTLSPSSRTNANKLVKYKNKGLHFLNTQQQEHENTRRGESKLVKIVVPNRHENSVSDINKSKSLYEWYKYLKKSGKFSFGR